MTEEPRKRRWGRVEPETYRWWQRYNTLKKEGFVHEEAARLARGIIGSEEMRRGRARRRAWYKAAKRAGLSDAEIEERIDEMYDTEDWMDPYSQFYPTEE